MLASTLLFIAACTAMPFPASAQETVHDIVQKARAAYALDARPGAILEATGTARYRGNDVPFTLTFGAGTSFNATFAGPLPYVVGFDGTQSWERDMGSAQRVLDFGERDAAMLSNWFITGAWTADDVPMHFAIEPGDADVNDRVITLSFSLDHSPVVGTIDLASDTYLPQRIEWHAGSNRASQELSNYESLNGVLMPTRVLQESTNGVPVSIAFADARSAPTSDERPFAFVATTHRDTQFDPEVSPQLEVRRAPTGHLLVHPAINGMDFGWFIFDTGAGANVISTPVADELGLKAFGTVTALGVGGTTEASYYRASALEIGPVFISEPTFVGIDLSFLDQHMGVRIGGVLGYELLARVVAEFDFASAAIALHDPAAFARDGAVWQPLTIYMKHPCLTARFEDKVGVFNLDTGAAQESVTFHLDAVAKHKLLEDRETRAANLGGVGGSVSAQAGTLAWIEFGARRFENVDASFATQAVGAFTDPYLAGSIGGQLLDGFTILFDYTNSRIALIEKAAQVER